MRGAGDHLSIGERVAFYRSRRGLTQAVLASLVNRSEDWVSKIERGERQLRRLDVVVELAHALRVTPGDLLGQPVLVEDDEHKDDDIPAIRDALMAPRRLSSVLFADQTGDRVPNLRHTVQATEVAWSDYQAGQLGKVISALPSLINIAQALERELHNERTSGWAASARIHHLAATTLSKVGEADLAWIAAERAMRAADRADDPLVLASAARAGAHALLSIGRFDDALELGRAARQWLAPQVAEHDPQALSLLGMLDLRMAVAAARRQDRPTTTELLWSAEQSAAQLGHDANYWQTAFGPTNVTLHRISTALDLGDVTYVVDHGPQVTPLGAPPERQVCHAIDVARALSYVAEDDAAIELLLTAERQAPHLVRHNPSVRETVKAIHRRSPVTSGRRSSPVLGLAERCRAIQ